MGRRDVAAVEAVTRRKVAAHHHEAGGGLDAKSPKQARIDPERLGGIIALPERRQRCLELCRVPGREAAQHSHAACAPHVANQRFERLGRHRQARKGNEARALGERCLLRLGALAHHRVEVEDPCTFGRGRDSLGKPGSRSLRRILALQGFVMDGLRSGADRARKGISILGMLGRTGTDGLEVDTFRCALRERQACERNARSERDQEKFPVHSAQQFRLRQTRYPMSSPIAGMTCPAD